MLLRPDEDRRLLEFRLGLTSGCPRPSRTAAELSRAEQAAGARELTAKVHELRPGVVALLGLTLYGALFPDRLEPGPGAKVARLAGARVFVLPNPSRRNLAFPGFEAKLAWFRQLAGELPHPGRRHRERRGVAAVTRGWRPASRANPCRSR